MRAENRALLGPDDVVLAAHPGSGASWIGTLLVHLGVFYVSGHEELLLDDRSQRTARWVEDQEQRVPGLPSGASSSTADEHRWPGVAERQRHLPALIDRDRINPTWREPCRVIKTNQTPVGWTPPPRVLLLVRDGRDAVLSLYHYLQATAGLEVSFLEFLTGNSGAWPPPAMSWGFACMSWLGAVPPERLHLLRFESCRERPLEEFRAMLRFLRVEREDREIEQAVAKSTYDRMRQAESAAIEQHGDAIGRGRIMRRGVVGEWREAYSAEMLRTFAGMPRRALERFGYPTDGVPLQGRG